MEKPSGIKDKNATAYITYLETELKKFTSSPYYDSYISLSMTIDQINKKIRATDIDITTNEGEIQFKRTSALTKQIGILIDQMESLRSKMSPEEKKKLEERKTGLAERMAQKAVEENK